MKPINNSLDRGRHFTQDELKEIITYLEQHSKKDASFDPIKVLSGSQWFVLLQDGENRKALIDNLIGYINTSLSPNVATAISLLHSAMCGEFALEKDYLSKNIIPLLDKIIDGLASWDPEFTSVLEGMSWLYEELTAIADSNDKVIANTAEYTAVVNEMYSSLSSLSTSVNESLSSLSTTITNLGLETATLTITVTCDDDDVTISIEK